MGRKAPTMQDIGLRLGIERSTVSRILRGDFDAHLYRKETIDRVRREAERLGYRPNHAARSLKTGRSYLVGVLTARIRNAWFGELAAELDAGLSTRGCRVIMADSNDDVAGESHALEDLIAFGVDGIIFAPCSLRRQAVIDTTRLPVVVLDYPIYPDRPCIRLDYAAAARDLLHLAHAHGYRRAGLVCHHATAEAQQAFAHTGAAVMTLLPPAPLRTLAQVAEQVDVLLQQGADCLMGLNNDLTIGLLTHLRARGLRVRRDIGVAGIDDFPGAELLEPPLTVVRQPIQTYAQTAVTWLTDMVEHPDRARPGSLCCRGDLVARESV